MRAVIAGGGVAGASLAKWLLKLGHEVKVYDGNRKLGCRCAWGSFKSHLLDELEPLIGPCKDLIITEVENVYFNKIPVKITNLCIINKPLMIRRLLDGVDLERKYVNLRFLRKCDADLKVWATGKPLGYLRGAHLRTYQAKVVLEGLQPNTAYIYLHDTAGYSWLFPASKNGKVWHLGAGHLFEDPKLHCKLLLSKYGFKPVKEICHCSRRLFVSSPSWVDLYRNGIVVVGEAAGVVDPISGEGILPSLLSSRLLAQGIAIYATPNTPKNWSTLATTYYAENLVQALRINEKSFRVAKGAVGAQNLLDIPKMLSFANFLVKRKKHKREIRYGAVKLIFELVRLSLRHAQ